MYVLRRQITNAVISLDHPPIVSSLSKMTGQNFCAATQPILYHLNIMPSVTIINMTVVL